jgi:hypothetical protein
MAVSEQARQLNSLSGQAQLRPARTQSVTFGILQCRCAQAAQLHCYVALQGEQGGGAHALVELAAASGVGVAIAFDQAAAHTAISTTSA